jgi:hypothetical protein
LLQLTQSIWLWAIAGIAVPIIIHLWNVKQGKTLKVGSIAFLTESARSHSTSLKLSELLLLLLRCLLIVVLAHLLTKPFWEKEVDITKEKGWLLIEKDQVKTAYNKFKPQIDSLLKTGYSFHYFNDEFKEAKFEDALKDNVEEGKTNQQSHWTLLKELNQKVPAKLPVYLFTNNQLQQFSAGRPDLDLNLKWTSYIIDDTASTWIESAYETSADSIRIVLGNSSSTGTYYSYQNITQQTSNIKFDVNVEAGKTIVTYIETATGSLRNSVEVDTSTNLITIYTDKFSTDAFYLKAAMDAIRDFTHRKMKTTIENNIQNIPTSKWIFWLSETEMPSSFNTDNSFIYQKGKVQKAYSAIATEETNSPHAIASFNSIVNKPSTQASIVWSDGFGQPLLTKEATNNVYHFYSRFNPQWNDLPWSNQFPGLVYSLLYPDQKDSEITIAADKRLVDPQQIVPTSSRQPTLPKQELLARTDLTKALWILAFILLLAERIISFRRKNLQNSGSIAG